MELKQAFWILRHGSAEGLPKYLEAVKTIEENCVQVVRCKDCTHLYGTICMACGFLPRNPDEFCSRGERKGGETDGS